MKKSLTLLFILFLLFSCEKDTVNGTKVNRQDMRLLKGTWVSTSIEPNGTLAKESEFLPESLTITFKACDTKSNSICSGTFTVNQEEPFEYNFTIGIYGQSLRTAIIFRDSEQQSNISPETKSYHFIDDNSLFLLQLRNNKLTFEFGGPTFGSYFIDMTRE
ncbi:hypothetical protein AFM12_09340 [Jiulongibacter sediminis]|uniref:Lipocalin-like domain-containing protein n=2 Tax=Jiulongibacter sediminis TaxID=1605367 RepID=A0A0P7BNF7_9BACT|nr:hypothetical protein AFM12_09340 [Jiulongibacter sediminis]TBX25306.1 hypothetical protein TK44_09345 [Jiulongibacter sediminis]